MVSMAALTHGSLPRLSDSALPDCHATDSTTCRSEANAGRQVADKKTVNQWVTSDPWWWVNRGSARDGKRGQSSHTGSTYGMAVDAWHPRAPTTMHWQHSAKWSRLHAPQARKSGRERCLRRPPSLRRASGTARWRAAAQSRPGVG